MKLYQVVFSASLNGSIIEVRKYKGFLDDKMTIAILQKGHDEGIIIFSKDCKESYAVKKALELISKQYRVD